MTVSYEIDPESGLIHTRCRDEVTFEEMLHHFSELESDETLPARPDVLLDLREMESLPESEHLKSVATEMSRLRPRVAWGACAIVAINDAQFGLSRMFQVFAEAHFSGSRVFREIEDAERWLGSIRRGTSPHEGSES